MEQKNGAPENGKFLRCALLWRYMMIKKMKKYSGWLVPILIAVIVYCLLKYVFLFGYVPTASMEPTLETGSYILGLRIYDSLEVGDIVIFEHDGRLLVKRIAASEGDTVVYGGNSITVPENSYYMLGDNTENSYDSRYWEEPFVSRSKIVAIMILPPCS